MPTIPKKPKKQTEGVIQSKVRAWLASQPDVTIFRNAQAYVTFEDGHKARVGLGVGSADLVGSLTLPFPYMMHGGGYYARSLGIEIKKPGEKLSKEQVIWHDTMRARGWIVGVATCVEDAEMIIEKARRWGI